MNPNKLTINMAQVSAYIFCENGVSSIDTSKNGTIAGETRSISKEPSYIIYTTSRIFVVLGKELDITPDNTTIYVDIQKILSNEPANSPIQFEPKKTNELESQFL